ncbi:hypothetical protein BJ546DRAFT_93827 [Cryomyces antarcticus]
MFTLPKALQPIVYDTNYDTQWKQMSPTTWFDSTSRDLVASRPTRERPYLPTPVPRPVEVQMRPLALPAHGRPTERPPMDQDRPLPSIESGLSRATQMARPVLGHKATFTHEPQQMHRGLPPSPRSIKATEYLPHDSRRRYAGLEKRLHRDTEGSLTNPRTSEYGPANGITARSNGVIQSRAPEDASFRHSSFPATPLCDQFDRLPSVFRRNGSPHEALRDEFSERRTLPWPQPVHGGPPTIRQRLPGPPRMDHNEHYRDPFQHTLRPSDQAQVPPIACKRWDCSPMLCGRLLQLGVTTLTDNLVPGDHPIHNQLHGEETFGWLRLVRRSSRTNETGVLCDEIPET